MTRSLQTATRQDLTTARYWDRQWADDTIVRPAKPARRRTGKRARTQPFLALMALAMEQHAGQSADVLEVGCAPGYLLAQYARLRPQDRLSGVDFATDGLQHCRRWFDEQQLQAMWHQADVREFAPEDLYDLVYSCGLIEHFTDPISILRDHVRLCKPGGIVAVSIPNYSGAVQQWFMQRLDPAALDAHNTSIMNTGALKSLMAEAGIQHIRVGGVGPATLRSHVEGQGPSKQFLRRLAQTWNVTNKLLPRISPWHSTLWAIGRVPTPLEKPA